MSLVKILEGVFLEESVTCDWRIWIVLKIVIMALNKIMSYNLLTRICIWYLKWLKICLILKTVGSLLQIIMCETERAILLNQPSTTDICLKGDESMCWLSIIFL